MSVTNTRPANMLADMRQIVEEAAKQPSTPVRSIDASSIRSYDQISGFTLSNVLSLPFSFFKNACKLIHYKVWGNLPKAADMRARVYVLPFGFGSVLSKGSGVALTLNIITQTAMTALLPVNALFAGIYFIGQSLYEALQGGRASAYANMVEIETLDALHAVSKDRFDAGARSVLQNKRDLLTRRLGETKTRRLFALLDRKTHASPHRPGVLFAAEFHPKQALRCIEADFIANTLTQFSDKALYLSPQQQQGAIDFFDQTAKDLCPAKALKHTLTAINKTVRRNFRDFSRVVRPWMAMEFAHHYHATQTNLASFKMSQKVEGIAKGRELLKSIHSQAKKTAFVHSLALIAALVAIPALSVPSMGSIPAMIGSYVSASTVYYIGRNHLAYGYLDAKGKLFSFWEATPSFIQDIYLWWKGQSGPELATELTPNDVIEVEKTAVSVEGFIKSWT